jgi:hypothetical protein
MRARVGVEQGGKGGAAQLAKLHTPTLISDPQSISQVPGAGSPQESPIGILWYL